MKIRIVLLTLFLCVFCCVNALAFVEPDTQPDLQPDGERLVVTTAWTAGELLYIEVCDTETGAVSAIELRLSDYAENCETITIQAVDFNGNKSGVIQIMNPYYVPDGSVSSSPPAADNASGGTPLTPDGTGSVVDNVTEKDGKEFFTLTTEAGNEFFLIVDRQKTGDNVYLLNAVTEDDLMALSKKGDGATYSAIPTPEPSPPPTPTPEPTPEPEPSPPPVADSGGGFSQYIIIILIAAAVGGAGYYFKIYKPKREAADEDDDSENSDIPMDTEDTIPETEEVDTQ